MRFWRRYRSAGVRVSAGVHRDITAGNRARDRRDWSATAAAYRRALLQRQDLIHIHVQLGHALKLAGCWSEAEQVYREAARREPSDRDAALSLGHLMKEQGRWFEAAECYVRLAAADPDDSEAMREARDSLGQVEAPLRRDLVACLLAALARTSTGIVDPGGATPALSSTSADIVFDISDLISYFSHSRRPTGIQRVQIEAVIHVLDEPSALAAPTGICCFVDGRDDWVWVPERPILHLARLSLAGSGSDEEEWSRARDRLHLGLQLAERATFAKGAAIVNLGTSWWLRNYFLHLRAERHERGIVYIPMVHDVIPAIAPELCTDAVVQDFVAWASGIFDHADRFLANSQATKRDLIALAHRLGHRLDPSQVAVVPLDGRYSAPEKAADDLPPPLCDGRRFVLLVATIEPRKGHLVAFEAWRQLLKEHDPAQVPSLVCVGRNGWRNAAIFASISDDPVLADKIIVLSDISDRVLSSLYDGCLFTLYPSLYEGWGLPVTEALSRGKMAITTTSSSLPEAGGEWAVYVAPGDASGLATAAAGLIWDERRRQAGEQRIARSFSPRSWSEVAADLWRRADELRRMGEPGPIHPPAVDDTSFHWIGRSMALEPRAGDGNGEAFRAGLNWYSPADWGCRVKQPGGRLAFRFAVPLTPARPDCTLAVRLVGSDHSRCSFAVTAGNQLLEGVLGRRERRSIALPIAPRAGEVVTVTVAGSTLGQQIEDDQGVAAASVETVGVEGFAVTPAASSPLLAGGVERS